MTLTFARCAARWWRSISWRTQKVSPVRSRWCVPCAMQACTTASPVSAYGPARFSSTRVCAASRCSASASFASAITMPGCTMAGGTCSPITSRSRASLRPAKAQRSGRVAARCASARTACRPVKPVAPKTTRSNVLAGIEGPGHGEPRSVDGLRPWPMDTVGPQESLSAPAARTARVCGVRSARPASAGAAKSRPRPFERPVSTPQAPTRSTGAICRQVGASGSDSTKQLPPPSRPSQRTLPR